MKQKQLSPESYIKTRARNLPIDACYINKTWKEAGMASIIIARIHTTGKYTIGTYLVDTFALGTKDTFYRFNVNKEELDELIERANSDYRARGEGYVFIHRDC